MLGLGVGAGQGDSLLRLHANAYACPPGTTAGPPVTLRGLSLPTIVAESGGPPRFLATMPVTFEAMQQRVVELPRSDIEPDGFFLITGGSGDGFWRLNGHMHEYAPPGGDPMMHRVELNGECPPASLDAVLRSMGWPECPLAFELVQEAVTLDEPAFRRWAAAGDDSTGVED
ncbi:MAG: hypothetical protein AAGG46_03795, partial [Planctomycetota bacterium]